MAEVPGKKKQGTPELRWGMWLHESGLLSFGRALEGEMPITDVKVYEFFKDMPQNVRWARREEKPVEPGQEAPPVAQEASATTEAAPVVQEAPIGPPDAGQSLGPDSTGHAGTEGPPGEPAKEATA